MKNIIRRIYLYRYGCRGALRPPLGHHPYFAPTAWQRIAYKSRFVFWKVESRIYEWTGLPQEHAKFRDVPFPE